MYQNSDNYVVKVVKNLTKATETKINEGYNSVVKTGPKRRLSESDMEKIKEYQDQV